MSETTFEMAEGLSVGTETHRTVTIREPTARDLIEASEDAEKIVETKEGTKLVMSPARLGLEIMRRQIISIGEIKAPFSLRQLGLLTSEDFILLQQKIEALEKLMAGVADRGRDRTTPGGSGNPDGGAGKKGKSATV